MRKTTERKLSVATGEQARLRLRERKLRLRLYRGLTGSELWNALATDASRKVLIPLLTKRNQLNAELLSLARNYGAAHPRMLQVDEEHKLVEKQLEEQVAAIFKSMEIQAAALEQGLKEYPASAAEPVAP